MVLSGALFNGRDRSNSPTRSPSPDTVEAQWPPDSPSVHEDKKLFGDSDGDSENGDAAGPELPAGAPAPTADAPQESIGMGPGRTGVKGVIRDADEHRQRERAKAAQKLKDHNDKLEAKALSARTFLEDEAAEGRGPLAKQNIEARKTHRFGRFGHLREVGSSGFVQAVEGEARGTWVVVHIYDEVRSVQLSWKVFSHIELFMSALQSLDRCSRLDAVLVDLARRHPQTKFLRARAAALGFATKPSAKPARQTTRDRQAPGGFHDEDEDEEAAPDSEDDDDVDTDMLPTLLAYLDGDLVHNWVRVDWEVKIDDLEELLSK